MPPPEHVLLHGFVGGAATGARRDCIQPHPIQLCEAGGFRPVLHPLRKLPQRYLLLGFFQHLRDMLPVVPIVLFKTLKDRVAVLE